MNNQKLISYLLENGKDRPWGEIGNMFHLRPETARKIWLQYRKKNPTSKVEKNFTEEFKEFLDKYKAPTFSPIQREVKRNLFNKSAIIINKQDPHLNKFDEDGDNDINKRFNSIYTNIESSLIKARTTSNLDKIYYIIGSDEFNSEWTSATTKGTPQKNILSYQEAFKAICDFNISVIHMMYIYADVEVIFIPGNHDEFVGWHMAHFLESFYQHNNYVSFDIEPEYTKYRRFNNSAIMFNHGDEVKPEKLAQIFPVEFRKEWGKCDNFYIFVGDKHHNHYKDLNGIEFYQLPAMSNAKSKWDKKNEYRNKGKLVSFVIEEKEGITDIYHQRI